MRKEIHPEFKVLDVKCVTCSKVHKFGTTAKEISIDVCSNCHPFYQGTTTSLKSTGRVERFNKRFEQASTKTKK